VANDRNHKLTVVGLRGNPAEFADILEQTIYGDVEADHRVKTVPGASTEFHFTTEWELPEDDLDVLEDDFAALSKARHRETFLLEYSSCEKELRGQYVISNGIIHEQIHRRGCRGPGPWYEIASPVVDLFEAHLHPRTLAQAAKARLSDAIEIVEQLKGALDYERGNQRELDYKPDNQRLQGALAGLTDLLTNMKTHAAQISFEGILLQERKTKAILR
jgi:hypothetical protein